MIDLPQVTLVIVDTINPIPALKVLNYCSKVMNFGQSLILTSENLSLPKGISLQKIPTLDYVGYSRFMVNDFYQYIDNEFCLIIQCDGFILHPNLWRKEFLDYDYIGAPWLDTMESRVGNGGFCLRSKKFLQTAHDNLKDYDRYAQIKPDSNEDHYLCRTKYQALKDLGIKFPSLELAGDFSFEAMIPEYPKTYSDVFGFHGHNDFTFGFRNKIQELPLSDAPIKEGGIF